MKTRFFSFGCSFTQYAWPTWADILGREYEYFENWGAQGAGNHFIFYSLIECIARNQIGPNDAVGIMWTSTHREDRFLNGQWNYSGSIYSSNLPKEYLDDWTDSNHYLLTSVELVFAAQQILDSLGCRYWFFAMVPIDDATEPTTNRPYKFIPGIKSEILRLYKPSLDVIKPSVYEAVFGFDWESRPTPLPAARQLQIELFRADYDHVADSTWPSFDQFIADDLALVSDEIRNNLEKKFNFFHRRNQVLNHRPDFHPTPSEHGEYLELMGFKLSTNQRAFIDYWDHKVATETKHVYKKFPINRF